MPPQRPLTPVSSAVLIAAVLVAISGIGILQWQSRLAVNECGFWFQDVTFELPRSATDRLSGPITEQEEATIEAVAESEVRNAFSDLRVAVTSNHQAPYRVLVVQSFDDTSTAMMLPGAAGQSRVLKPLGGRGSVNFVTLALAAIRYAPAEANRAAILDGIGRGIGRSAAHEFAHQLVPGAHMDTSHDDRSYEFASADRAAQYYGAMHWDGAKPTLLKNFGR